MKYFILSLLLLTAPVAAMAGSPCACDGVCYNDGADGSITQDQAAQAFIMAMRVCIDRIREDMNDFRNEYDPKMMRHYAEDYDYPMVQVQDY